jgi:aquaporin Z
MAPGIKEVCAAEFVGTFLLVFTVGCNVLAGNPVWGGLSIASSLMVSIYALGAVSGANFNPAVSLALGLAGKMGNAEPFNKAPWKQVGIYCGVQLLAGVVASLCYGLLFQDTFNLGPAVTFAWWQAMMCEFLYTFMLCFVVLNVAASKQVGGKNLGGKNQSYGLAIGFVIVAGAYGPGAVSGGCFNPAVAFAIDSSSMHKGFGWCLVYSAFELLGAVAAVGAFKLVRPEEQDANATGSQGYDLKSKLIAEAIGTYMLVLTVGLNVLVESKAAAFSIAASLMCMIYALGDISGGHFNPAVTAALFARKGVINMHDAGAYAGTQLVAGLAGALTYALVHGGVTFPIGPGPGFNWGSVMVAEIVFTFVLCYVVLCVASVKNKPASQLTGFIIGSCVTVGGLAIGKISGGSLNPAVSFGIAAARVLFGGTFFKGIIYMIFELIGGLLAAGVFKVTHPHEHGADADEKAPLSASA